MENNKRPETMERITTPALAQAFIDEQIRAIRQQVVVKMVPQPSLSMEPPSSTKSRQSTYSPLTQPSS